MENRVIQRGLFRRSAQQGGIAERQAMINRQHPLSVVAQCKLLGVPRARVYRLPTPPSAEKLDLISKASNFERFI